VGLCQYGAQAMAREGKDYKQILRFYYPTAKIASR
jgi:stage II sporulation protein D